MNTYPAVETDLTPYIVSNPTQIQPTFNNFQNNYGYQNVSPQNYNTVPTPNMQSSYQQHYQQNNQTTYPQYYPQGYPQNYPQAYPQNYQQNYQTNNQVPYIPQEYAKQQQPIEKQPKEVNYIIHKVQFTDSMDGLALQYNVSAREIRTFNGLTTDDIYYLKELKIPNPDLQNLHEIDSDFDVEELRRKQKVQTMQKMMEKDDAKSAQFYLEEHNWDINAALRTYQQDLEFEKKHQQQTSGQSKYQQIMAKKAQ